MLRRRVQSGLTQKAAAETVGANTYTYLLWEGDKIAPGARFYPAIFAFLGYDPHREPVSIPERIVAKRRTLGLSRKAAAARIGMDEATLARWERGGNEGRVLDGRLRRFLS